MLMRNPRLTIDIAKIRANAGHIVDSCSAAGLSVMGVTKSFSAYLPVVRAFVDSGIHYLADSRIQNIVYLKRMKVDAQMLLLRIPMPGEIKELVTYGDFSVNSEVETIQAINAECHRQGKKHGILLMVDSGDLREGFFTGDELLQAAKVCAGLPNIEIRGLASSYGCYGGVLPTVGNTGLLVGLAKEVEKIVGYPMQMLSVGGTVALELIENGTMPAGINNLRVGEAITMGMDTSRFERRIPGTCQDAFTLTAEIVELKEKPSVPVGDIGYDAFTGTPKFIDRGIRKRAICAVGKQDLFIEALFPRMEGIEILGASSDHLLLDVSDAPVTLKVGGEIDFDITWSNMLRLTTSKYVRKHAINTK
jgi:ornithine racemase